MNDATPQTFTALPVSVPRLSSDTKAVLEHQGKSQAMAKTMMVDAHKLAYLPIAKNACSSLKRLLAGLGGVVLDKREDIHHKLV